MVEEGGEEAYAAFKTLFKEYCIKQERLFAFHHRGIV